MVIWSSTQAPPTVQTVVGRVLDVPLHQVSAKFRRAGGGFGAKATRNLPHAAAAAVAAKVREYLDGYVGCWELYAWIGQNFLPSLSSYTMADI